MNCMAWLFGPTLVVLLVTQTHICSLYLLTCSLCPQSLGEHQVSACTSEEYYFPGYSELVNKWFGDKKGEHRGAGQMVPLKIGRFLFQLVVCGNLRRSILTARRCFGSVKVYTATPSPADRHRINKTLQMLIIVFCSLFIA